LKYQAPLFIVMSLVLLVPVACSQDSSGGSEETSVYKEGRLRVADRALPVVSFIGHMTAMDLVRACQMATDARKKAGDADATLCFERGTNVPLKTVRIEHREGMLGSASIQGLASVAEGAHFIIEPTGSVYQTMDLAHAVRRGATYRPGEIRVVSGSLRGHGRLLEALAEHWPTLVVEEVTLTNEIPAPASAAPPTP
jgi:hypothetical protein